MSIDFDGAESTHIKVLGGLWDSSVVFEGSWSDHHFSGAALIPLVSLDLDMDYADASGTVSGTMTRFVTDPVRQNDITANCSFGSMLINDKTEDVSLSRAVDAYSFLYPLVLAQETGKAQLTTAPNEIQNVPIFPPPQAHKVVRPNEDTLYSIAWLNLTDGPLLLSVPDTGGRYYLLQMMSLWTSTFADPGKRTTGTTAQQFAIVGPRWNGTLPPAFAPASRHFVSPTEAVWMIGRTQTNGTSDYPAVHAVQKGYRLEPLADAMRGPAATSAARTAAEAGAEAEAGAVTETRAAETDTSFTPPDVVAAMDAEQFFTYACQIMLQNPPTAADAPFIRDVFVPLGLPAGDKPLDWTSLPASVQQALNNSVAVAQAGIRANASHTPGATKINGWDYPPPTLGQYGTDYSLRSSTALRGLGANPLDDALYLDTDVLPAGSQWTITFRKGSLPPVQAFWSFSAYDIDGFFVPNTLQRYALHDWDPLQYDPSDGSLVLYFGDTQPPALASASASASGGVPLSNWLPAPKGKPFSLTLRMYWPEAAAINHTWTPPALVSAA